MTVGAQYCGGAHLIGGGDADLHGGVQGEVVQQRLGSARTPHLLPLLPLNVNLTRKYIDIYINNPSLDSC